MDDAGAVRLRRSVLLQGLIIPETQSRTLLALLVPEIAALVNAVAQVGDGAYGVRVFSHWVS
jgi:hypothetical protein